eukprot:15440413-Alexandrium_andersonii.AAC.1
MPRGGLIPSVAPEAGPAHGRRWRCATGTRAQGEIPALRRRQAQPTGESSVAAKAMCTRSV